MRTAPVRRPGLLALALITIPAPGARADPPVPPHEHPGQVVTRVSRFRDLAREMALSGAEQAVVRAKLSEIVKVLRTHAIFNPPKGFDAELVSTLVSPAECRQPPCRRHRVAHEVRLKIYGLRRTGGGVRAPRTSARGLTFTANQPGRVGEAVDGELTDDLGRPLLKEPRLVRRFAGVPLYEGNLLVLVRTARPLFLPVTREQFLRARLRQLAQEADADQGPIQRLRGRIQAELTRMTPAQRQSEAWVGDSPHLSGLAAAGAEDAHRVVILSPAFLDPRLPRTAIQILTAEVTLLHGADEGLIRPLTYQDANVGTADIRTSELLRTFDFQKLVALIDAR
jgi:hypothetical protein